ncbi:VWA domain-containing protein [Candidatus Acetothermia bacterium]|jgi:PKD repeat protein|nr:VWA domain-containing protein [Candidatus Acetothermia bacterium]MCI2432586.1 VWA domain-containing protein [Candidatus Acetothermia bacterium]MCI2436406.1 VWA domain-containing protein [Candidatus Acetothermia bacterium]
MKHRLRELAVVLGLLGLGLLGADAQTASVVELTLSAPPAVFVKGSAATPQEATLTLKLTAGGPERTAADLLLVLDRSSTVNMREMQKIGLEIVNAIPAGDRVGLVSFGTEATLDVPLTFDHEATRQALKLLRPLGRTAVGEGLATAIDELTLRGRKEAAWTIVLVSDGRSNIGRTPLSQAQAALGHGIAISTIGIRTLGRSPDLSVLREIARLTGGQFFESFSATVPQRLIEALAKRVVARQLKIALILPTFINYELATFNAPNRVVKNPDNTTLIEWLLLELLADDHWEASFVVSGSQIGTTELRPSFSYIDSRGRTVTPSVRPVSFSVRGPNRPPTANFEVAPAEPTINDQVSFVDRSTDPDGKIVAWEWQLGDGNSSGEQNPVHRYAADGLYTVTLTVTDSDGATATKTRALRVFTPRIVAVRSIETHLPGDQTLPGEKVLVTLSIRATTRINGFTVVERIPKEWEPNLLPAESGVPKTAKAGEIAWVFLETLDAGQVRTIQYELKIPEPDSPKAEVVKLSGMVSSAAPAFENTVAGETEINIVTKLPMRVIFARMDTSDAANPRVVLSSGNNIITFDQIQVAVSFFWLADKDVKNRESDGKVNFGKIDLKTLQELVAYWLTETPIFEPLPK